MIKYNNSNINDWFFSTDNIIKVYRNNAICYYKLTTSGGTSGQTPCFAVVDDISQYSDTEFEDVFNKADNKWYKLNNLNQYEEYGVYGDSIATSGGTSRLPSGYTEVEYIRNSNYNAYINTGVLPFDNTTNSYTITTRLSSEFHSNLSCATIISAEVPTSPYNGLGYRYKCASTVDQLEFFGGNSNYSSSVVYNGDGTRTVTFQSTGNTSWTSSAPLSLFCSFSDTSFTTPYRFADVTLYSATIIKNGLTVRDYVPAKRDSDSVYGLYDLINDVFYSSPNGNNFSGGSAVTPTAATYYEGKLAIVDGYEYQYSGDSWVSVGEVSASTIDTVWIDPPSTSNQNANFNIGHYWGEGYKMVFNAYLSGSYGGDYGSFWRWEQHTPIEFNFYSNGFYYDFHNPTSTSAPDVDTNDYSWRIMKNNTLGSYENNQIFNVILTNGTVSVKLEETGAEIVNGSRSVSTQSWYNGLYQASLGSMNSQSKCHLSHIQVYNANDELVNDIKFVKNQGVTRAQEISAYDSVLNVTYNNTNSYTPVYHIVESGTTEYPLYYDEIQDPPNNLSFSSMTEAEEYECPWVGMRVTIDGVRYIFSGDSQSGYEWVYQTSRLPAGYTEVEYIENSTSTQNTQRTNMLSLAFADSVTNDASAYTYSIVMQLTAFTNQYENCFGYGYVELQRYNNQRAIVRAFGREENVTAFNPLTNKFKFKIWKGENDTYPTYYLENLTQGTSPITGYVTSNRSMTNNYNKVGLFHFANESDTGAYTPKGRIYEVTVEDRNGNLVCNGVPCKRDSDGKLGFYNLARNEFEYDESGVLSLTGGPEV